MKIIADAFGGDNAPVEVLKGCRLAVTELEDVEIVLTGDKDTIEKTAREHQIPLDHMEICHAGQVMDIHTEPTALLKEFSDSSMANLQSVSIIAAFPVGGIILLIIGSFFKDAGEYLDEMK